MSTVLIDLTKISQEALQVLQAAGLVPPGAAAAPAPTPAPAAPALPAAPTALAPIAAEPAAVAEVAPPTLADKISQAVGQVGKVLTSGVAGPEGQLAGGAIEAVAGLGKVIWETFHPHTQHTSQHGSLQEAILAGAQHMTERQSDAVAQAKDNVAFTITPKVQITAADVAKLPPGVAAKSAN